MQKTILKRRRLIAGLLFLAGLLLIWLPSTSCAPVSDFDKSLGTITWPYAFDTVQWELENIFSDAFPDEAENTEEDINEVLDYFTAVEQIEGIEAKINAVVAGQRQGNLAVLQSELEGLRRQNLALAEAVEKTIEKQVKEVLSQQGIYNPIDKYINLKASFPPVNFNLEKPPHLLVVSPRDRIDSIREIPLQQRLVVNDMEDIETSVDELGVSSLVVELGGFAVYPSFVSNEADLMYTIETVIEEWVHQYLFFKPLGFLYLLDLTGISRNYEIATMNETVASMVSTEIGSAVYRQYYSRNGETDSKSDIKKSGFDFNREMRNIRRNVDKYLARGEIELAEEYMEQKRKYLERNGHYIRKLNQAYFAFHGAYADSPTSISPIGVELRELRDRSNSLKDFLASAAAMTTRRHLAESVQ